MRKRIIYNLKNTFFLIIPIVAGLCGQEAAYAAQITEASNKSGHAITAIKIEGKIVKGDFGKLQDLIIKTGFSNLYLASPGGDFLESIKIGRLVRTLKMRVNIPRSKKYSLIKLDDPKNNICASSCFLIYVAGVNRFGYLLGMHRPYLSPEDYKTLNLSGVDKSFSFVEKTLRTYFEYMGVPQSYFSKMMSVNSDEMYWLTQSEINQYFDGYIPQYRDWFKSHCTYMTSADYAAHDKLVEKGRKNWSEKERKEYAKYDKNIELQAGCEVDALHKEQLKSLMEYAKKLREN